MHKIKEDHLMWWLLRDRRETDERRANLCGADLRNTDLSGITFAGADLRRSNLSNANLSGANLTDVDLSEARLVAAKMTRVNLHSATLKKTNLSQADLSSADLSRADLKEAKLINAQLMGASLTEAELNGANLSEAKLIAARLDEANLEKALLVKVDLSNASLSQANLNGTLLDGAILKGITLDGSDLTGASLSLVDLAGIGFDLKPGSIPNVRSLTHKNNLSRVLYHTSPNTLVELREAFKKAGMREEEREITFAIKRQESQRANAVESTFNLVMFELPSEYGMSPGRPIRILGILILFFSIPYMFALKRGAGESGIWVVWPSDHEDDSRQPSDRVTVKFFFQGTRLKLSGTKCEQIVEPLSLLAGGLFFSLLSAFNIGWKDLNVGNWISRLQPREYTLRATGWVRFVSGLQSLISVYLLALWVLTYFGRPFE